MSDFDSVVEIMSARTATLKPFKKVLRFKLDDHIMIIDGTTEPPSVGTNDVEKANATIKVSLEDFQKLLSKELKPMTAFRKGQVRMEGEMGAASALQKIF